MLNWINKKRNKKGFTLIELVVVIAILGILAAIAVPRLGRSRTSAAVAAHNANVKTIESAATMYIADGGADFTIADLTSASTTGVEKYIQKVPSIPAGAKITGDADNYKVTIKDGAITITPGLRKVNDAGTVVDE